MKSKNKADRKDILAIINRMLREGKGIDILNELKFRIGLRDRNKEGRQPLKERRKE